MAQPQISRWSYSTGCSFELETQRRSYTALLQAILFKLRFWSHWFRNHSKMWPKNGMRSNLSLLLEETESQHSRAIDKPLPLPPLSPKYESPRAPPPLANRTYLDNSSKHRPITWSEDQINILQEENRKLRRQILAQKRVENDKDRIISMLRQHNRQANQELNRQNEAISRLANMAVSIQGSTKPALDRAESCSSGSLDYSAVDIIQIYHDTADIEAKGGKNYI